MFSAFSAASLASTGVGLASMEAAPWIALLNWIAGLFGISMSFSSLIENPIVWDGIKLVFLGSMIQTATRVFRSALGLLKFRYTVTGEFKSQDLAYQWVVSYLTKKKIWKTPYDFVVETRSSQRQWGHEPERQWGHGPERQWGHKTERQWEHETEREHSDTQVRYLPRYTITPFFRWKGYFLEVTQPHSSHGFDQSEPWMADGMPHSLFLKIYTRRQAALFEFVEECRLQYTESSKAQVAIYSHDSGSWSTVRAKNLRPIESLVLDGNIAEDLIDDAREFMDLEDWYMKAGIPHRRGYLLYGPPGTGKTSTVYTIAGVLGLDIYVLSLSTSDLDDTRLAAAVSSLPPRGILLIEDIDCAFPSRTDEFEEANDPEDDPYAPGDAWRSRRSPLITLSGLLNVLDGIGSEEGKIFFATTNHIERLDPALLRPGRIDRKIPYKLASRAQCRALFNRFFPATIFGSSTSAVPKICGRPILQSLSDDELTLLADTFANQMPEHEFSVAELQGYLLDHKLQPLDAARGVEEWVGKERALRVELAEKKRIRKEKARRAKAEEQLGVGEAVIAGIGNAMARYYQPAPAMVPVGSSRHANPGPPQISSLDSEDTMRQEAMSPVAGNREPMVNGVETVVPVTPTDLLGGNSLVNGTNCDEGRLLIDV